MKTSFSILVFGLLLLLSACGTSAATKVAGSSVTRTSPPTTRTSAPGSIAVREHDFGVMADTVSLTSGTTNVVVTNDGPSTHELLAFRTDLPDGALPLGPDGRVNEDGPGLTKVLDTGTDLAPHTQRTLTATLAPGRYVFVCNLPGHYSLGMHTVVTVTS